MSKLNFTIDSALLEELGKRLVGKPYIALAELVKNGYDADAREVTIVVRPDQGYIKVYDNGHGMQFEHFEDFWMRIGTPHKSSDEVSQYFKRPLTGSKGVGRLSVQLLADKLKLRTVYGMDKKRPTEWIEASVDWQKAINAGDLTSASVDYTLHKDNFPFPTGTELTLEGLRHEWGIREIRDLANEIWWLQPPFGRVSDLIEDDTGFRVNFHSSEGEFEDEFNKQRDAIFPQFDARLVGRCENGQVVLSLEFEESKTRRKHEFSLLDFEHNKNRSQYDPQENLNYAEFEIRIYSLKGRLKDSVRLTDAKNISMIGEEYKYTTADSGFLFMVLLKTTGCVSNTIMHTGYSNLNCCHLNYKNSIKILHGYVSCPHCAAPWVLSK